MRKDKLTSNGKKNYESMKKMILDFKKNELANAHEGKYLVKRRLVGHLLQLIVFLGHIKHCSYVL